MKKTIDARILDVQTDDSIPYFQQITKTVQFPYPSSPQIYYTIKPSDYVTVLANTLDDRFLLVRQYRPAVEDYTFELPSGHVERGETPDQAAVRELEEETNCRANGVRLLGKLVADTGRLENRLWAFYASGVEYRSAPHPHENEGIEVHPVSMAKLRRMIQEGSLAHALDLAVISLSILNDYVKF